jgi:hypothetical protein
MALHRVEQILAQVRAKILGLPTTGARVYRSQAFPLDATGDDNDLPALLLYQGAEVITEHHVPDEVTCELEVFLEAYAIQASGADTTLNQIRLEHTGALVTDSNGTPKLDLDFVEFMEELGADAPEISSELDRPALMQRASYRVVYMRNRIDPST